MCFTVVSCSGAPEKLHLFTILNSFLSYLVSRGSFCPSGLGEILCGQGALRGCLAIPKGLLPHWLSIYINTIYYTDII